MRKSTRKVFMFAGLAALMASSLMGCGSSSSGSAPVGAVTEDPGVYVKDTAGQPVAGAKIYAIPATDVEALAAVAIDRDAAVDGNYSTTALTVDEPLEDIVNGNFTGGVFDPAENSVEVDENGYYKLTDEDVDDPDAKYFIYVGLAADDTTHLPGGSICREPVTLASLVGAVTEIEVSTKPSATATFVGTSACLECHDDKTDMLKTAHKLGFMNTGAPSALQDTSEFAADRTDEYNMFAALAKYEEGVTIYYYDYDSTRSFDKFKTLESDPRDDAGFTGVVYASVTLSKDVDGKYWATFDNIVNPGDPESPMTHEVVLTYGGGVYKQRPITVVDDSLFMVPFQFNARGDEASADRTRRQWRDYHMDWWKATIDTTPGSETMTFKTKPAAAKSVDVQCAPCHFNGYSVTDVADGYYQATGVADVNGETHPATGEKQELNIGCETCHGPGSEHVAAEGLGVAIVTPQNLAPERESIICGQCHARAAGNGTVVSDATLDANDKMMVAGTSRAAYLANNTTLHDALQSKMWDGLHAKAHHQQYTDFIQSAKYRNGTKLMTCSSCHDLHAPGTGRHQLSGATDGTLCASCHETQGADIGAHQTAKVGVSMGTITCIQCHNTKTSQSGAGSNQVAAEGLTGTSGTLYLHGDITSHVFDVPSKADAVAKKMPVPYTAPKLDNSAKCGLCHGGTGL